MPSACAKTVGLRGLLGRLKQVVAARLHWPIVGHVRFGDLQRTQPISRLFGLDRAGQGCCIDRYYIEQFLAAQSGAIRGRVLEVADNTYTVQFGGGRVTHSDILHVNDSNPRATIVADLTRADSIPSDSYDCIICTQTFQFIYDVRAAAQTLYRILRPGGILLATASGISQISRYDMDRWGDYWRFTSRSLETLLGEIWARDNIEVRSYGNVMASIAYLHGLTTQELTAAQLDFHDSDYQLLLTIRAVKPLNASESLSLQ